MECKVNQIIPFGATGSEFIVGEIVLFHFCDGLYQNGKIDTRTLRPIARLASPNYTNLGEIFTMKPVGQTAKTVLPR